MSDLGDTSGAAVRPHDGLSKLAERAFVRAIEAHRAGRMAEAQRLYADALNEAPDHLQVLNNLGVLLRQMRRRAAAEACLRRALALDPRNAGALANLANLLRDEARLKEARACFAEAVESNPDDGSLWLGLGRCQRELGELGPAVASFGRALALTAPEARQPPIAVELALTLLCSGDYANGFEAYEARWKLPELVPRHAERPAWDGGELAGRRLLLWAEQGLSETLQLVRYVPLAAARGAEVTLEVQPELAPLLQGIEGAAQVVARGDPLPPVDLQAPLAGLPRLFRTRTDSVPGDVPYLPDPERRVELPAVPAGTRRVGLVWSGRERPRSRPGQEPGLTRLLPLAAVPGVQLLGLQKGPPAAELVDCGAAGLVRDLSERIEGWRDLAAALTQLDLLVAVDSPSAHLAGALGRPCWLLLPSDADWRWGSGGAQTPWYPSLRLFRQPAPGDWAGAVAAAAAALAAWAPEA